MLARIILLYYVEGGTLLNFLGGGGYPTKFFLGGGGYPTKFFLGGGGYPTKFFLGGRPIH